MAQTSYKNNSNQKSKHRSVIKMVIKCEKIISFSALTNTKQNKAS